MDQSHESLADALARLRADTGSDMVALAQPVTGEQVWRWTHAVGSSSGRIRRFIVKPGKGVAGVALQTGRPVAYDRHRYSQDLRRDDAPLWSVERLETAAAAPVLHSDRIAAVILIASRRSEPYSSQQMTELSQAAERIGRLLSTGAAAIND